MANHNEYPRQLKRIPRTQLAYMITPCAVNEKNGFDKYRDYLTHTQNKAKRVLRNYCYKIYKMGDKTLDELKEDILSNNAIMLADTYFEVTNQNLSVDENNNLCLKTYGSDLENLPKDWYDCLVSADGTVLRQTNGSMVFRDHDAYGNYFALCFVSKSKPMTDEIDVIRLDYNFLTPDGHKISKSNFQASQTPVMIQVPRTYSYKDSDKLYIDSSRSVYPMGYIYDGGKEASHFPIYLPSATAVLIENRTRIEEGQPPIVEDETPYLEEHYTRIENISKIQRMLTEKFQKGKMSYLTYKDAMATLDREQTITNIFTFEFETDNDRMIGDSLNDMTFGNN